MTTRLPLILALLLFSFLGCKPLPSKSWIPGDDCKVSFTVSMFTSPFLCELSYPMRKIWQFDAFIIRKIFGKKNQANPASSPVSSYTTVTNKQFTDQCIAVSKDDGSLKKKRSILGPIHNGGLFKNLFDAVKCSLRSIYAGTGVIVDYVYKSSSRSRPTLESNQYTQRGGYFEISVDGEKRYLSPYMLHGLERCTKNSMPFQVLEFAYKQLHTFKGVPNILFSKITTPGAVSGMLSGALYNYKSLEESTIAYWNALLGKVFDPVNMDMVFDNNFIQEMKQGKLFSGLARTIEHTQSLRLDLMAFADTLPNNPTVRSLINMPFKFTTASFTHKDLAAMPFGALSLYFPDINTKFIDSVVVQINGRLTNLYDFDLMDMLDSTFGINTESQYTIQSFLTKRDAGGILNRFKDVFDIATLDPLCKDLIVGAMNNFLAMSINSNTKVLFKIGNEVEFRDIIGRKAG